MWLRQSTEVTLNEGPFLSNDTGTLNLSNLTITPDLVKVSKNDGTMVAKEQAGTAVFNSDGDYLVTYGTGDTSTLGKLKVSINAGTALPVWNTYEIVEATKYDAFMGTNSIPVGTVEYSTSSNLTKIDGNPTNNNSAVLSLNQLDIQNGTGAAVIAYSTGAVTLDLQVLGGNSDCISAVTSGNGHAMYLEAVSGNALYGYSSLGNAVVIESEGASSNGLVCIGSNADILADIVGTLNSVSSIPSPTGGTVDLAIQVNTLPSTLGTVQNILANQDKTGYDLNADQSAVTFGTVGRVISIPNSTGGTMDHVITAGTLLQTLSRGEPAQGAPPATTDSFTKNDYIYKTTRNKKTNNGTNFDIWNDAGDTVDQRASVSSDGTTATISELTTGA